MRTDSPRSTLLALAGGVGGAKLAWGLSKICPSEDLAIVVNTGDDDIFHGLHVSPDLDTVMYTLAGLADPDKGWGIAGDSFHSLSMLEQYGAETWFRLGDRDLATHIERTRLLHEGWLLTSVTRRLCTSLGISATVAPMSDSAVRTHLVTEEGDLSFQEYFVHRHCQPRLLEVRFAGADQAIPSAPFAKALKETSAIVFCPSNPIVSIGPILSLLGVRETIARFNGPKVAVSPIVGGRALKGPAAKMLTELGMEPSCVSVARFLSGVCDTLVIDREDKSQAEKVRAAGLRPIVLDTVMTSGQDRIRLAGEILERIAREPAQ